MAPPYDRQQEGAGGLQDSPEPQLVKLPPMKGPRQHVWLDSVFGIVMMRRSHMLQTQVEIKEKVRKSRKAKLSHAGAKVGYGQKIEDGSENWSMCSLMSWPKEQRFRLYRAVLKAYGEECVAKPKEQVRQHDEEAFKRKEDQHKQAEARLFKKAVKQQVCSRNHLAATSCMTPHNTARYGSAASELRLRASWRRCSRASRARRLLPCCESR